MGFEYIFMAKVFLVAIPFITSALFLHLWIISLSEDIKHELDGLSRIIRVEKNPLEIKKRISEIVQFHSKSLQLSGFNTFNKNLISNIVTRRLWLTKLRIPNTISISG